MNAHNPYHSPCPVCGRPTRFKQWPTHCACNRYDPKPFTFPWENNPARQEEIRQAKQRVAEWEEKDGG